MTFWEKCHEYERLLSELGKVLDDESLDPISRLTHEVIAQFTVKRFWRNEWQDQKRAYEMYVVSRSPLPEHFAYLWES